MEVKVGDVYVATSSEGTNCNIVVKKVTATAIILDGSRCSFKNELKVGSKLQPSLFSDIADSADVEKPLDRNAEKNENKQGEGEKTGILSVYGKPEERTRFGVSLGLIIYSQYSSSNFYISDGTSSASGVYTAKMSNGFNLALDVLQSLPNSWGYQVGALLTPARSLDKAELTLDGVTYSSTGSSTAKYGFLTGYFNFLYRWQSFYIPFGINVSSMFYEKLDSSVRVTSGFGAQLGLGYMIADDVSVEYVSQSKMMELNGLSGSSILEVKNGYVTDVALKVIYYFN